MRFSLKRFAPTFVTTPQSTLTDLEKNHNPLANNAPPVGKPPNLLKFQILTGISSPSILRSDPTAFRPAPNQGIYQRTVDEESKVKFQYDISKYIVNSGGMLQIVVGAALTALGAAAGPSAAVTILGAVNTVIAGLLTYLKGQGLPTRLEQYLHLLRTLREHVEEREREFLEPDCSLDVDGRDPTLLKKPDIHRSEVAAPRGDKSPAAMLASGLQDLATFGHHAGHDERQRVEERLMKEREAAEAVVEKEREHLGDEIQHLGHMAKDALDFRKRAD
ncbi:MAG: hypothetical protein Q9222_005952 [Ikaeria aurantiellina]